MCSYNLIYSISVLQPEIRKSTGHYLRTDSEIENFALYRQLSYLNLPYQILTMWWIAL